MTRVFEDKPATRERVPTLIGLTGVSSSGKTFSALRLATGIQRAVGGEIFVIDTEARRATHYADRFSFRHVNFEPPFGPLDYLAAIEHCVSRGAKVLVIDSMSHEHNGDGGVMDQVDAFLDAKAGDDFAKRQRFGMLAHIKPKAARKKLNRRILQLGINAVFCYRAADKIKPAAKGAKDRDPVRLGWQPETTSPLVYEMTARFLLGPGCEGRPILNPETDAERNAIKNPIQFHDLLREGAQLSEDLGERIARWGLGDNAPSVYRDLSERLACALTESAIEALVPELSEAKEKRSVSPAEYKSLRTLYATRLEDVRRPGEPSASDYDDEPPTPEPDRSALSEEAG
jgi:hypothetical protein